MSELTKALVAAQKAMPELQRDKLNPAFKSRYLSLEKLLEMVIPVLNAHGLALMQHPTFISVDDELRPALQSVLVHGESGDQVAATMPLVLDKQTAQGQGSAITYARRYALMAMLGLSADEDDDGNAASSAKPRAERKPVASSPDAITEAQRKRLFAVAREAHVSTDAIKAIVKNVAGVDSSNDIPRDKYDLVIAALGAAA